MVYRKKPYVRTKKQAITTAKKSKRWYLNASADIPFVGKGSLSVGNGMQRRALKNTLENLLLETKTKLIEQFSFNCLHGTIITLPLLSNIPIAVGDAGRISDRIHVKSIRLNFYISQRASVASTATVSLWRVILLKHTAEYGSGSDAWISGLGSTEVFQAGSTTFPTAFVDYDKCTVIEDKVITLKRSDSAGIDVQHFSMNAFNIDHQYNSPTSNYSKTNTNMYVICVPWADNAVVGTTQLGSIICNGMISFTDSK